MFRSTRASRPQHTLPRPVHLAALTAALLSTGAAIVSCRDTTPPNDAGTFYGPPTALGGGTARAYVVLDRAGVPTEVGAALTEAALTALPSSTTESVLAMPAQASATPYKHVGINWQPTGHPPVFQLPHFDVHFYAISMAERQAIAPSDPAFDQKANREPPAEYVPPDHVHGGTDPMMGTHWPDASSTEFHGGTFTRTFVYGSYDGKFIFVEPMITKAYLESRPTAASAAVKLPAKYSSTGYQPTSYTVTYDASAKEYHIALTGLVLR